MVKHPPAMQETWVQSLGWENPLERKWLPTPVFLLGKSHGQGSLVGYSPLGCKKSDTTEQLSTAQHSDINLHPPLPPHKLLMLLLLPEVCLVFSGKLCLCGWRWELLDICVPETIPRTCFSACVPCLVPTCPPSSLHLRVTPHGP